MAATRAGRVVTAAVGITALLQLGGTHECTVTHGDDQTTYDIRELSHFMDARASKCTFTWSDASDTVVGTYNNKMEPVISSSFGKLVSSKCIGNMTFSGTCVLEGTAQDYMASCTTRCRPEALIEDKGNSWIGAAVAAVIFLLVVCLGGFLCCKYQIQRKCSCSQTGGFYTAVKFQKSQQAVVDVERGNG